MIKNSNSFGILILLYIFYYNRGETLERYFPQVIFKLYLLSEIPR